MTEIRTAIAKVLAKQDDTEPNLGHFLDADALLSAFEIGFKGETEDHVRCCGTIEPQYTCPETVGN